MANFSLIGRIKFYSTLILIVMSIPVNSQVSPASDTLITSAGYLEMYFIGHGSLMLKTSNSVIYVDPVSSMGNYSSLPKADIILVTHEHSDHLDAALIKKLKKESTVAICNKNSSGTLPWARVMIAGEKQKINGLNIEAVPAYNIKNERAPGKPFHPKGSGLGYILGIGGKRIYVAGDTENTPEVKALRNIDVAFLPMDLPYTMTPEMVADAALAFRPNILYPYHYGETDTNEIIRLLKNSGIEVRIRNLK